MRSFVLLCHLHCLRECGRKTLLRLNDNADSPENIRSSIPGQSSNKAVEGLRNDRLSLAADNTDMALEDQVDTSLSATVGALDKFLCHPSQHKFVKYFMCVSKACCAFDYTPQTPVSPNARHIAL
jgi:hypothetical protein